VLDRFVRSVRNIATIGVREKQSAIVLTSEVVLVTAVEGVDVARRGTAETGERDRP
jgi:hypothetical protein